MSGYKSVMYPELEHRSLLAGEMDIVGNALRNQKPIN